MVAAGIVVLLVLIAIVVLTLICLVTIGVACGERAVADLCRYVTCGCCGRRPPRSPPPSLSEVARPRVPADDGRPPRTAAPTRAAAVRRAAADARPRPRPRPGPGPPRRRRRGPPRPLRPPARPRPRRRPRRRSTTTAPSTSAARIATTTATTTATTRRHGGGGDTPEARVRQGLRGGVAQAADDFALTPATPTPTPTPTPTRAARRLPARAPMAHLRVTQSRS